jgi:hypothetical protein
MEKPQRFQVLMAFLLSLEATSYETLTEVWQKAKKNGLITFYGFARLPPCLLRSEILKTTSFCKNSVQLIPGHSAMES